MVWKRYTRKGERDLAKSDYIHNAKSYDAYKT